MLKFIYTEADPHLELLGIDLADWVDRRCMFAASTGESISIDSERATILLPATEIDVQKVAAYLRRERVRTVTIDRCDLDDIEVTFTGFWISTKGYPNAAHPPEGIFVTQLIDRVESYLWQLWYAANYPLVTGDPTLW